MKSKSKRLTAVILSAMLTISAFTATPVAVSAAETSAVEAEEWAGAEASAEKVGSVGATPASGVTGDCTWVLDENGTLTISGDGEAVYKDTGDGIEYFYELEDHYGINITKLVINEGVTGIGWCAFSNCSHITGVSIPDSVTYIDSYAFNNCTSLTDISIPDSLTSIGYEAFDATAWYKNQPDGVVYIGKCVYKYKGKMPMNTYLQIKDGTTGIAAYAFDDCENLKEISLPDSLIEIGGCAFSECSSLSAINLPDSLKKIDYDAFYGCYNLEEITFPNGLKTIGRSAFLYCYRLKSITIPDSVTLIEDGAFAGCTDVEAITVSPNNPVYDSRNNCNAVIETATDILVTGCKSSIIPNGIKRIGPYAFAWSEITEMTIPNTVTSIGDNAFTACYDLSSLTIPDSVTVIEEYAFEYCSGLKELVIPDSVTSIGDRAFCFCRDLKKATISKNIKSISDKAFYYCEKLTDVTIPYGVTKIGYMAFSETALRSVVIPDSVTSIESDAFLETQLIKATVPASVEYIGERAFGYYNYTGYECTGYIDTFRKYDCLLIYGYKNTEAHIYAEENGFSFVDLEAEDDFELSGKTGDCTWTLDKEGTLTISGNGSVESFNNNYGYGFLAGLNVKKVVIENGVTDIGSFAFYELDTVESITIPETVKSIGEDAFSKCSQLNEITIPGSVESIGDYAFYECSGLEKVNLSDGTKNIGKCAFYKCSQLDEITIPGSVESIGDYAFYECSGLEKVNLSDGTKNIYHSGKC